MESKVQTLSTAEQSEEMTIDLLDLFWYLLKKWKIFAVSVLLCAVIAVVYLFNFATPIYESTAQLYVVNSSDSVLNLSDLQIGTYLTSDYQLVFDTWEVNQQVIQNLKLPYTIQQLRNMVRVTNPSSTRALLITVTSPNAKEAADIANEMARVARKYIAETMKSDEPTTLSMALEPLTPVKPQKTKTVILAVMLGILIPAAIFVVMFVTDDKIKTSADIQKYTGAAPLAVLPAVNKNASWERRNGR